MSIANVLPQIRTINTRVVYVFAFRIIERNGGKAPLTYHQFQALVASMPPPPPAEEAVNIATLNGTVTPIMADHDDRFGVPTLEELGKLLSIYSWIELMLT